MITERNLGKRLRTKEAHSQFIFPYHGQRQLIDNPYPRIIAAEFIIKVIDK